LLQVGEGDSRATLCESCLAKAAGTHLGLGYVPEEIVAEHPVLVARVSTLEAEVAASAEQITADRAAVADLADERDAAVQRATVAETAAAEANVAGLHAELARKDGVIADLEAAVERERLARSEAEDRAASADAVMTAIGRLRPGAGSRGRVKAAVSAVGGDR
jgi:hypothetical protein